ncbi:ABC transporter permease, partial [Agrobacterium tumefaciens]
AKLRDTLRHELTELHRRIGATSLYVTHDQAEAMAMSDRIVVMNAGRVVEIGTPLELYRAPKHAFTAGFLGQTNLLPVSAEGQQAQLPWDQPVTLDRAAAGNVQISVRPENINICADQAGAGTVSAVSFMGANALYTVEIGGRQIRVSQSGAETLIDAGQRVALQFPGSVHLLDDRMAGP